MPLKKACFFFKSCFVIAVKSLYLFIYFFDNTNRRYEEGLEARGGIGVLLALGYSHNALCESDTELLQHQLLSVGGLSLQLEPAYNPSSDKDFLLVGWSPSFKLSLLYTFF